jgi:hypothetical protein
MMAAQAMPHRGEVEKRSARLDWTQLFNALAAAPDMGMPTH